MDQNQNQHCPVLLEEIMQNLPENQTSSQVTFFDGTFGGGGYSNRLLESGYKVFACDLDQTALDKKDERINTKLQKNLTTSQNNFANYIQSFENKFFDGIVLDLGFSSNQLTYSGRGFSYQNLEENLDLRYNINSNNLDEPAYKKISKLKTSQELGKILYDYSGDMFSAKISKHIIDDKIAKGEKLQTVEDFVSVIKESVPKKFQNKTNATLSRIWQAMRIWVNQEFESLEEFLPASLEKLKIGGRLYVVCFHSLEDKIVTKFMREKAKKYFIDDFGNQAQDYKLLTAKPIKPSQKEVEENPRSRSATLRILERIK